MKILITGARAPVAAHLVMGLARLDHEVTAADCFTPTLAAPFERRLGVKIETYPCPAFKQDMFGEWMRAALCHYDLIIPTCEEVFFAADALEGEPDRIKFLSPGILELDALHSKWGVLEILDEVEIPRPKSCLWPTDQALPNWDSKPQDSVVKPVHTRFGHDALIGPERMTRSDYMQNNVVQERLRGEEICSTAILYKGEIFGFSAYRSNWRVGNASVHFDPSPTWEDCGAQLRTYSALIGAHMGYTGILSLDAIGKDGAMHVIEVNPRATSGLHLFRDPEALFNALTGQGRVQTSTLPLMLKLAAASQMPWEFIRKGSRLRSEMNRCNDAMSFLPYQVGFRNQLRTFKTLMRRAKVAGEPAGWNGEGASRATVWDIAWNGLSTTRLSELRDL
jgi:hypothetical protein